MFLDPNIAIARFWVQIREVFGSPHTNFQPIFSRVFLPYKKVARNDKNSAKTDFRGPKIPPRSKSLRHGMDSALDLSIMTNTNPLGLIMRFYMIVDPKEKSFLVELQHTDANIFTISPG